LRADFLGCYGNREIPTPSIDALAAEGLRFSHARANSTTTPGSYASLLTGLYPAGHGFVAEWGTLPAHLPTLPTELARAGYHTALAASEREVALPQQGFSRVFGEVLPCLANPHQPGDMTTRRASRWLEEASDGPWFLWVSYFDTHPPYRAPEPILRNFYDGDPRDPARAWREDDVRQIHGIETITGLEAAMALLEHGTIDARLVDRLRATALALLGEIESGPDLAAHVARLGPGSRLGMAPADFGRWLRDEARSLAHGTADLRLVRWMRGMVSTLREEERGLLAWVEGVVDYAYPVAQAKASVAHLDRLVGELLSVLRREGLYEDCTIVLSSPHGEMLGEEGHHFHHHTSLEPVLRVPLILKPGRHARGIRAGVVEGVFQSIDLLPTLLEVVGLPLPVTDGQGLLGAVAAGRGLPDRDSFAVDVNAVRASILRPPHKLIRWLGWDMAGGRPVPPGTTRLSTVADGGEVPHEDDALEAELAGRLDAWLSDQGLARAGR
ncbi:MAG: sulfatase-like hydrolase/transferase, partial [Actinobacteria bacterium]|nr:sulfatase-like hydrolase/transferase [Actinomycetota bacterium]